MSNDDAMRAMRTLADNMRDLQRQAAQQYLPVVDDILHAGSRDPRLIEQTLDGLLDFCGHEPVLKLYKKLCRYYWGIDPAAVADYVHAYRERWESDEQEDQP